jgi:Rod binding domain-containing protein
MDVRDSLGVSPNLGPMDFLRGHAPAAAPNAAGSPGAAEGTAPTNLAKAMSQREIDHVAEGFDAIFASLLIKQMRQTLNEGGEGEGGMFGKDSGDVLGGLFDTFMGDHLAKAGGLGIGKMVKHQLEQMNAGRNPYAAQAAIGQSDRAAAAVGAIGAVDATAVTSAHRTAPTSRASGRTAASRT